MIKNLTRSPALSIMDHLGTMTNSELNTILTVGLAGAASLFSLSDMAMLDNLQLSKSYLVHFEIVAVISVVSAVAVSKLIWPEYSNIGKFDTVTLRSSAILSAIVGNL